MKTETITQPLVSAAKTFARTPAAQQRVQNLIPRLRALENRCGREAWANVVAACREALEKEKAGE